MYHNNCKKTRPSISRYTKFKKLLTSNEIRTLSELLDNHFYLKNCGCNVDGDDEEIYLCPIGMYEDGCSEKDLVKMIQDIAEDNIEDEE